MVYPKFWRFRMNWKKKISSASSIDLQESLAASVTYLYLKNFKALCVILNHLIEAHISDKAFTPRFLSKVNKMKRKVTYSYEERNQSRIRESYWSGKSYLSWHKGYFDVSSLFQDLMFKISVSVINHSISNAAEIADLSAHHICLKLRDLFA